MSNDIGFIIEYVVSGSESYLHAIGRCGDYPIHVGDEFDRIHAPALILRDGYQGLGEASPVKLHVDRIEAYQRQLPTLGRGMTGTIDLRGEGLNRVIPGAVLGIPAHSADTQPTQQQAARTN
jgi:hypothetical protein